LNKYAALIWYSVGDCPVNAAQLAIEKHAASVMATQLATWQTNARPGNRA
jgi:hypothetical protein